MPKIHTILLAATFLSLEATKPLRSNIIFILVDDQDVTLGGLTPLAKTLKFIGDQGITFTNAFATTPICCPSRSSILTGLYLHSHGTVNNSFSGGCSNRQWQSRFEGRTFGAVLHNAGYRTFYAGKYLNEYGYKKSGGVKHVPEGWDWWIGLVGNSVYYNYTLSVNGSGVYKGNQESDYLTDVLKDFSLKFLNEKRTLSEPFLMVIAPPSPHEPFTPANRHKGKFSGLKAPRIPSFNRPVNKTKHWLLRLPPDVLPPETVDKIDEVFRNRWETLLSVDELVTAIIQILQEREILNSTYVMFSSDHGFHLGQFGLPWDKRQPYETDVKIPLMVRGPNLLKQRSRSPVLNIDFAATILNMAGVLRGEKFGDGKSFLREVKERTFLIEYRGESGGKKSECYDDPNVKLCTPNSSCKCFDAKNNTFTCVRRVSRRNDDIYCEFEDEESFEELYDIRRDPYQIDNRAGRAGAESQKRILQCLREKTKAADECLEI